MASVNAWVSNFTAGEMSPRLYSRVDLAKYGNAAREITNFIVMPHGGARRRGGTRIVSTVKNSSIYARLIEFVFSTTQAYILEFGPNYIRFYKDRGQIYDTQVNISGIATGATTTLTAVGHGFADGDRVVVTNAGGTVELNNREFTVAGATTNTFNLSGINSSTYGAYTSGGEVSRIYEITTVYSSADIEHLYFTQSADTLFIFSPTWPLTKLVRSGHADWTIETAVVEEGPFLDFNTDDTNTVSLDAASGTNVVMTFSVDTLETAHEGALFRIWEKSNGSSFGYATWAPGATVTVANDSYWEYNGNVYYVVSGGGSAMGSTASYPTHTKGTVSVFYGGGTAEMRYEHSGYCVVQVDQVVDSKNALVTIVKNRTPYTAYGARSSPQWQEGAWSDLRGYPATASFHEQRLVAASTEHQPSTVWGSQTGIYLGFKDGDKDDEAYIYTIASDQVDAIKYLNSTKKLVLLTSSSEYILSASRSDEAVTPTNVRMSRETNFGSANVRPIRAGPAVLFAQRAGDNANPARRLREFVYNFQTDSYVAPDLTILAEHITYPGIVAGAFQATPDLVVWYARSDGDLVGLTYERDQQVVGWHKHALGANEDGGLVKWLASIPGSQADEVWMIVERQINGATVRTIEWLQPGLLDGDEVEDGVFLDCSLTYDGTPATTISGLWHLEGEAVSALADGVVVENLTVSGGAITLETAASLVHVGYGYTSRLRTLRIEAGAQQGTAQGAIGRINEVVVRLDRTVGGKFGRDDDNLDPIQYRLPSDPLSSEIELFTGDKFLLFDGEWDTDRYITLVQDKPLPMHVLGLKVAMRVSG